MLQKYNKLKCLNAQWAHEEEEEHPITWNKGELKQDLEAHKLMDQKCQSGAGVSVQGQETGPLKQVRGE